MNNKIASKNEVKFFELVKRQNAGLWFGILFLAYAALFFKMSFDIPYHSKLGAGPGMYPRWLSGFSILIALVYILQPLYSADFFNGKEFEKRIV